MQTPTFFPTQRDVGVCTPTYDQYVGAFVNQTILLDGNSLSRQQLVAVARQLLLAPFAFRAFEILE